MQETAKVSDLGDFSTKQFIAAMLAINDIRCKTYISYGAMNSIFQYLE